jgi:hypothetical protein
MMTKCSVTGDAFKLSDDEKRARKVSAVNVVHQRNRAFLERTWDELQRVLVAD